MRSVDTPRRCNGENAHHNPRREYHGFPQDPQDRCGNQHQNQPPEELAGVGLPQHVMVIRKPPVSEPPHAVTQSRLSDDLLRHESSPFARCKPL